MAAIRWYGPLIDLSTASSYVGDHVQLLVFVHRSSPVQYKLAKGGMVIRTDIHVGDDTRPFFSASLWDKQMASMVRAGDIILLQNFRITRFGNITEARTVQYSSILCLVHSYESLSSKGINELVDSCRVGVATKEKLKRVIEWVQQSRSMLCKEVQIDKKMRQVPRNWKDQDEQMPCTCCSLPEVLQLSNPCRAIFSASVGKILLPFIRHEFERETMFLSRRLIDKEDNIMEDIICTGCQICGSPLGFVYANEQKTGPLYCKKSSDCLHTVGFIYRPFMIYAWESTEYIPVLVTNKAAEILFGNIRAEKVYQSYKKQIHKDTNIKAHQTEAKRSENDEGTSPKLYLIWLILLRTLMRQGENSPLRFEILVNPSLETEDGRFEMVSVSFPCS